jgi:hypothetical protein
MLLWTMVVGRELVSHCPTSCQKVRVCLLPPKIYGNSVYSLTMAFTCCFCRASSLSFFAVDRQAAVGRGERGCCTDQGLLLLIVQLLRFVVVADCSNGCALFDHEAVARGCCRTWREHGKRLLLQEAVALIEGCCC